MRCSSFGVICNYMPDVPDLQPLAHDSVGQSASRGTAGLRFVTSMIWSSDGSSSCQLDAKRQDFITRYLGRSFITPDDPNMVEVNRGLLTLAFTVCHSTLILAWSSMTKAEPPIEEIKFRLIRDF